MTPFHIGLLIGVFIGIGSGFFISGLMQIAKEEK